MRLSLIILMVFTFLPLPLSVLYGQSQPDNEYDDVILLKSGGVYLDVRIVETVPEDKIVVENTDGVEIEIPFRKIYAVTDKENYPAIRKEFEASRPAPRVSDLSEPEHFMLLGIASGGGNSSLSAAIINGYYIRSFFAGAGLGWDDRRDGGYISFLIDVRLYGGFGKTKSYVYSEIGFFGGSRVGMGLGLKIPWGEPVSVLVQGGFRRQGDPDGDSYSAGVVMIGITFKT